MLKKIRTLTIKKAAALSLIVCFACAAFAQTAQGGAAADSVAQNEATAAAVANDVLILPPQGKGGLQKESASVTEKSAVEDAASAPVTESAAPSVTADSPYTASDSEFGSAQPAAPPAATGTKTAGKPDGAQNTESTGAQTAGDSADSVLYADTDAAASFDSSAGGTNDAATGEEQLPSLRDEIETEQIDPSYEGWRVSVAATAANPNRVEIATFAGRTASVTVPGGFLSDERLTAIGRALDATWNIPGLTVKQTSVYVETDRKFRFVIFPSSLIYEENELKDFLPSGITFVYDTSLIYDVVLKVNNVKPRVKGTFVSAEDFALLVYRATIFPDLYLYDNDLANRVERLEKAVLSLAPRGFYARPYSISPEVIQFVKNMYNENNNITKKEVIAALKEQKIKYASSDVDAIFAVLFGVYD